MLAVVLQAAIDASTRSALSLLHEFDGLETVPMAQKRIKGRAINILEQQTPSIDTHAAAIADDCGSRGHLDAQSSYVVLVMLHRTEATPPPSLQVCCDGVVPGKLDGGHC
jgi:hypothetical protein